MSAVNPEAFLPLITDAARRTGLPWHLLYCQMQQESNFDPNAESNCGALGLMQLMPSSFPGYGRAQLLDPAANVRLGSEFLRELVALWRDETPVEALKFGLACYNCGSGYVLEAQRLARAGGADSATWEGVRRYLPQAFVHGRRADVAQVTDYVARIFTNYEAAISERLGAA